MNNKSILLIDPEFDPKRSEQLDLLVKIGLDSFSYAIIDGEQKLIYAVFDEQECENGYEKLSQRLKVDSYLKLPFKNVKVAGHTQNQVLVPNELFDLENLEMHTSYFTDKDVESVFVQPFASAGATSVFALPKSAESEINLQWPDSIKLHENAGILNLVTSFSTDTLVLNFTVGNFEVIFAKDKQVILQQNFQFDDVEEFTYYLLLLANQLQIDTKAISIKTCGIIDQNDEKWKVLTQYFNSVDTLTIATGLDSTILDDMPTHYYTTLLSLYACGS